MTALKGFYPQNNKRTLENLTNDADDIVMCYSTGKLTLEETCAAAEKLFARLQLIIKKWRKKYREKGPRNPKQMSFAVYIITMRLVPYLAPQTILASTPLVFNTKA